MKRKVKTKEDGSDGNVPTIYEVSIWKFYEWAVVVAPILLMLSHWYIFYVFSQNNHELLRYSEANEVCIVWIYTILYLYVPLMLLPASYFFGRCNLFRIPFVYFIFINVERWYYGEWFCTNEMVDTHYILIYCIMCIYVIELAGLLIKNIKKMSGWVKALYQKISKKIQKQFEETEEKKERRIRKEESDKEMYDKIMGILDD